MMREENKAEELTNEAAEETAKELAPEEESPAEQTEGELPEEAEVVPEGEAAPEYEAMTLTAEEVKALKEKIDGLEAEKADAVKQAQRLQAEFENYRKRNAQIASESRDDGIRETIKLLLPVYDSFERAIEHAPDDPFAEGVVNIEKQFRAVLDKCGVEEVPADGVFDPNDHDAVMKDHVEGEEPGKILEVFQKGYKVKGKIVRFSMVKVNE